MTFLRFIIVAVLAVSISAIAVTEEGGQLKEFKDAIKNCEETDVDCAYLAYNAFRHFNPDSEFVASTKSIETSMHDMVGACEAEDSSCDGIKAYAFSQIFPDNAEAKAKAAAVDMSSADSKAIIAEIDTCVKENPLCKHLILGEYCEEDSKDAECLATVALDEKFEAIIEKCEGKFAKRCAKMANKAACGFFPAACDKSLLEKLTKRAEKVKDELKQKKGEVKDMVKSISKCETEDKDCAFLAFKTYRHFFPESKFVEATTAFEEAMQASISSCESEDKNCDALKAYAFSKVFPDSADAQKDIAGLDLTTESNAKFVKDIDGCIAKSPLCLHMIMADFCTEDTEEPSCVATLAADEKFEGMIDSCESHMGKFCKKIAQKTACKFFPETCKE